MPAPGLRLPVSPQPSGSISHQKELSDPQSVLPSAPQPLLSVAQLLFALMVQIWVWPSAACPGWGPLTWTLLHETGCSLPAGTAGARRRRGCQQWSRSPAVLGGGSRAVGKERGIKSCTQTPAASVSTQFRPWASDPSQGPRAKRRALQISYKKPVSTLWSCAQTSSCVVNSGGLGGHGAEDKVQDRPWGRREGDQEHSTTFLLPRGWRSLSAPW